MDEQLTKLQNWYFSQCNGDWEHGYGIRISTIDNPAWCLQIDLKRTQLQDVIFDEIKMERSERDWIFCRVTEQKVFEAYCGTHNIIEILQIFNGLVDAA